MLTDEQKDERGRAVSEMHRRREKMADEKRYIIYYTFGASEDENKDSPSVEETKNV